MVKLEKVLKCDICHNDFDMNTHRPLVAKCGHTFCKHCILCNHNDSNFSSCPIDNIQYVLNIESCIPNIKLEEVITIFFNFDSVKYNKKNIVYSKPEVIRNKAKSKNKIINFNEESFQDKVISLDKNQLRISSPNKLNDEIKYIQTEPILFGNAISNMKSQMIDFDKETINNRNNNNITFNNNNKKNMSDQKKNNNVTLDDIPINDEKSVLNCSFKDEMNSLFKKNSDKKNSLKISRNFQSKESLKEDNELNDSLDKISKIDDEILTVNNNDFSLISNKNIVNALYTKTNPNDNNDNNYEKEKMEKYKKYTKNINLVNLKRNNSSQDNLKKYNSNSDKDTDCNSNGIKEKIDISPNNKIYNNKNFLINNNENIKNELYSSKTIDIFHTPKMEKNIFKSQLISNEKYNNRLNTSEKEGKKMIITTQKINPINTLYKPRLINSKSSKTGNLLTRSYISDKNCPILNYNKNNNLCKYSTNTLNHKTNYLIENENENENENEDIYNKTLDNKKINYSISSIRVKPKISLIKNPNINEIENPDKILTEKYINQNQNESKTNNNINNNKYNNNNNNTNNTNNNNNNSESNMNTNNNIIYFGNSKNQKKNPIEEQKEKLLLECLNYYGYNGTLISRRKIEETINYKKLKEYITTALKNKIFSETIEKIRIRIYPNNDFFIGYLNANFLPQKGIFYYNNGDYYEGDLLNGIKEGFGYLKLKNGTIYEGDFKNNKQEGYGKLTQIDGEIFNGEWKEGKIEGKGIRNYNNGDKYIGNYKNNLKEGNGKYFFSNGNFYEGNWENGKANGIGKFIFNDGNIYEGEFKDNIICGNGIFYMKNGDKYIGTFKNGFIYGRGICENNKGEKYSGFFSNGKKNGMGKITDVNGNIIASGYWNNDVFIGKINNM